jgi:hypothetical protein
MLITYEPEGSGWYGETAPYPTPGTTNDRAGSDTEAT